jgi:pyruvyltransferase
MYHRKLAITVLLAVAMVFMHKYMRGAAQLLTSSTPTSSALHADLATQVHSANQAPLAEIPLFVWRPEKGTNFGDELSFLIVQRMLERRYCARKLIRWEPSITATTENHIRTRRLLALGSIGPYMRAGDIVWGTGYRINDTVPTKRKVLIKSARGPKSRALIMAGGMTCPAIYGDPGLLLPFLFPELRAAPIWDYIVIPHLREIPFMDAFKHHRLVLPTGPAMGVVNQILSAKFVISSSLHGIIIAEAFGIPAVYLRQPFAREPLYKYEDYYAGTGRHNFTLVGTIEEGLASLRQPPLVYDIQPLLDAFPYDELC